MAETSHALPQTVIRALGDRSYDRRKNAALDIESHIKLLQESEQDEKARVKKVREVVELLGEFACSTNAHHRKGGLIGLAATAIGLMGDVNLHLKHIIPFVLHCFDDPESRVRYYACESLYNIAKVARKGILEYFNQVFDGLCKLFADVDVDVKNGANLLDRLIKDIVTESKNFDVDAFIPSLKKYISMTNPYIRQLMIGWIRVLHDEPEIDMLDWLPEFLDGIFNMLSDNNREIRQHADHALTSFMEDIKQTDVVQFGPMVTILVEQCGSKERFHRLQAITWVKDFIDLGKERLAGRYAELLGAIMHCISDQEEEIVKFSKMANDDLRKLVKQTTEEFTLDDLHRQLMLDLAKDDIDTKKAVLQWFEMLLDKAPDEMERHIEELLPALLEKLSDADATVVEQDLKVLARISNNPKDFHRVLNDIVLKLHANEDLLKKRGSMIIRQLCDQLDAKEIYIRLAEVLRHLTPQAEISYDFASLFVNELNLILLTAHELQALRDELKRSFVLSGSKSPAHALSEPRATFNALFETWCHNPVATFSLCLLAQAYELSSCLVRRFADVDVTVGFLMQIDKLVQLLESPIFIHLRLELLEPANPQHAALLKSLYGLLMLLPQVKAFEILRARLDSVATLTAGIRAEAFAKRDHKRVDAQADIAELLQTFEEVQQNHKESRIREADKRKLPRQLGSVAPS
eukprot:g165.t1